MKANNPDYGPATAEAAREQAVDAHAGNDETSSGSGAEGGNHPST